MAIDLLVEHAVSVSEARRTLIPKKNGRPISPATAYRWIRNGIRAKDGKRVKLEAVLIGREYMTTREAVQRFIGELTRRSGHSPSTADRQVPPNVEHDLQAAGILAPGPPEKKTARQGRTKRAASTP